jgi:hypothetical protein
MRPATLLVKKTFQQSLGGFGVAAKLDDFVENITILIDGPPEVASLAVDRYDDFVQMPDARCRVDPAFCASSVGHNRVRISWPSDERFRRRPLSRVRVAFPRRAAG